MQNPTHLIRSEQNIYHFRWPMPLHLMPDGKRRYIKLSLGTREPKEALYIANGLSYAAKCLLKHLRLQGMDYIELKDIVQTYLQRAFKEAKENMDWRGANSLEVQLYRLLRERNQDIGIGLFDTPEETRMLHYICKMMELPIDESDPEWERLKQAYRAALPNYSNAVLGYADKLTHDFTFDLPEESAAPVLQHQLKAIVSGTHTLSKMIEKFIAVHVNDEAWDENTKNDKEAKLVILTDILGKDYHVADMDLMKAREVRDIIKQLPRNLNKSPLLRGMLLEDAMKVQEVEKLSPTTAQKYLNAYSALFGWCLEEGVVTDNPFAKLKSTVDKKKKSIVVRKPFNAEQLQKIQAAAMDEKSHYRHWGTLIGMYTGARLNEVAQLTLDDIKQKDGVWYFDMNDEEESKRLKTPAARRKVPIHKVLLDLGIIEEVAKLRKAGRERFLYELTYDQKNGYGKKLSHYFNAVLLPKLDIKRKELVFHSFRHTVNTCLYQAGVPESVVQTIIGHERSGTSQQVYFKEGYTLQQLKEAMDKYDPTKIVINN